MNDLVVWLSIQTETTLHMDQGHNTCAQRWLTFKNYKVNNKTDIKQI